MPRRKTKGRKRKNHFGSNFDMTDYQRYSPGENLKQVLGSRNRFGALNVPSGMRPVSDYRRAGMDRPFIINPYGPPQPWITQREEAPSSSLPEPRSRFGSRFRSRFGNSLADKTVNPSGYLSTWYAHPRNIPTSWNPYLYQGGDGFRSSLNSPTLRQVDY
jgi:hypothetical protein